MTSDGTGQTHSVASADITTIVWRALDHALHNGYFQFLETPVGEIAEDLIEYDADLEDCDPVNLIPAVREWFACHGRPLADEK